MIRVMLNVHEKLAKLIACHIAICNVSCSTILEINKSIRIIRVNSWLVANLDYKFRRTVKCLNVKC